MRFNNSQCKQSTIGLYWIDCICKHISSRKIFHILNDISMCTTNEAKIYTNCFTSSAQQHDILSILKILLFPDTFSTLSKYSKIMKTGNNQCSLILFCYFLIVVEIGRAGIIRKQCFCDNKNRVLFIFRSNADQDLSHMLLV